jgi:predicted pyridoxine 5'-phosphate oxidase superfamily flavin-nucleotide-binding protein
VRSEAHNLLQNPNVGLIFFVPGRRDSLRVAGKALIVRDPMLRQSMAVKGRAPELATVVSVERAYFHCGACIARAALWDPVDSRHDDGRGDDRQPDEPTLALWSGGPAER